MKSKLILAITLIIVSIMAITVVVSANGSGKMMPNPENEETMANFNGEPNSPYPLKEDESVGVQFSLSADATFVGIGCPSWSDDVGELTLKMYKFDKDYATTVKGTVLISNTYEDYEDNAFLGFEYTAADPLKAGEYLIVISDPFDEGGSGVGLWTHDKYDGQHFYEDGIYNKALSARMHVIFKGETPATPYGKLTAPVKPDEGSINKDSHPFLGTLMRFTDPEAESYFEKPVYIDDMTIVDGKLIVPVIAGDDPQFVVLIEPYLDTPSAEEYPVMLIRLKREADSPKTGEIFFTTTDFAGPAAAGSVKIKYEDTTEWQDVVIDLSTNKNYKGDLLSFRFDIVESASADYEYQVEYILFFGTVEAAKAFKPEDLSALPTPAPTPEPTATPIKTATPVKTDSPATPTPKAVKDNGGSNVGAIIAIVAVVVVIGVIVFLVIKKKKS